MRSAPKSRPCSEEQDQGQERASLDLAMGFTRICWTRRLHRGQTFDSLLSIFGASAASFHSSLQALHLTVTVLGSFILE